MAPLRASQRRSTPERLGEGTLLELIDLVYAAAEDSERWDPFLSRCGEVFRAPVGAIVFEDLRTHKARVTRIVGMDPDLVREYEQYYAGRNAWMEAGLPRVAVGEPVRSEMLLPDDALLRTEYYDGILRPLGARHLLAAFLFRSESALSQISFLRPHSVGECDERETALFAHLIPHLQRAFQLHRRLVELKSEHELAIEALDRVPVGVLLLDGKGKAFLVNRSAREILSAKDGLSLQNDGLHAGRPAETAALHRLLSDALQTGAGKGVSSGGVLSISRPSLRRPYSVFVTPLRADRSAFGESGAVAAVFLSDPEKKPETNPEALKRLYGFTPAEARIAERLLQGESVGEAAEELHVSVNTARTHVKSMFDKTDTHRHRELLRILLSGIATIRTA
jgi:DNA-binding CsgD family transcriptional regulator/PAS domain-containing protein